MDRLSLFKVLADRSRYSIYQELAGSPEALSATDISSRLDLHPNTVRLHLEKMREAGLVEAAPDRHGSVGRPQYRWRPVGPVSPLGLEPAGFRLLAHLLAEVAADSQLKPGAAAAVGRRHVADRPPALPTPLGLPAGPVMPTGSAMSVGSAVPGAGASSLEALIGELAQLGFDPAVEPDATPAADGSRVAGISFTSCPFRELAVQYPDVVCELHRGITEGLASGLCGRTGGSAEVVSFSSLVEEDPCRVEVSFRPG